MRYYISVMGCRPDLRTKDRGPWQQLHDWLRSVDTDSLDELRDIMRQYADQALVTLGPEYTAVEVDVHSPRLDISVDLASGNYEVVEINVGRKRQSPDEMRDKR